MSNVKNGARYVRCPKCRQVIVEFVSVPIYQCRVCNTTLRAKCYNSEENNSSLKSLHSNSGKQDINSSLRSDFSSSRKDKTDCSIKVQDQDSSIPIHLSNADSKDELNSIAKTCVLNPSEHIDFSSNQSGISIMRNQYEKTENKSDLQIGPIGGTHRGPNENGCKVEKGEHVLIVSKQSDRSRTRIPGQVKGTEMSGFIDHTQVESSEYRCHRRLDTSLQSEEFYTSLNWLEPEEDEFVESVEKNTTSHKKSHKLREDILSDTIKHLELVRTDIMSKLDSFRDEINNIVSEIKHNNITSKLDSFRDEINSIVSDMKHSNEGFHPRQNRPNHCRSGLVQCHSAVFGIGRYYPDQCRVDQPPCFLHCHAPCICCCNLHYRLDRLPCYSHCRAPCICYCNTNRHPSCALIPQLQDLHCHGAQSELHEKERSPHRQNAEC